MATAARTGQRAGVVNPRAAQRAIAVGVVDADGGERDQLAELKELLRTAGVATAGDLVQRRDEPDPDRYLGKGKIAELKREIKIADANLVACDDELVPRQERNLEKELGVPVIDRTAVILDIFADHAGLGRGQAPGRAGPARVQPGAPARPLDPPRAPRWRPGKRRRARSPGAPARPRSRPTAAWRANRITALRRRLERD